MKIFALFRMKPDFTNFCLAEAKALLRMFNKTDLVQVFPDDLTSNNHPKHINESNFSTFPLVRMNIDENTAKSIINRSVLINSFVNVYYQANDLTELKYNITHNPRLINSELESAQPFKIRVKTLNLTISHAEKIDKIRFLEDKLNFKGRVDLENAERTFLLIEDYDNQTNVKVKLRQVYFAKLIAKAPTGDRAAREKYKLIKRAYLGPTSCDNDLAFVMANLGLVSHGDFVFDPFVGSGGLLIPPAHLGAVCLGGELDMRVLQGYGVGRYNEQSKFDSGERASIWTNFQQYGLRRPDILRIDSSSYRFRKCEILDAIICDPPYGIRAMVREIGSAKNRKVRDSALEGNKIKDSSEETQPDLQAYDQRRHPTRVSTVDEIIEGLFRMATDLLKVNGRIVFLYPVRRDNWKASDFPQSSRFKLVDYCENPISGAKSRICVVVEKTY